MAEHLAKASVLLYPEFDNLTSNIQKQLNSAFSSSTKIGSSAGGSIGSSFSSGFSAKMGAISGIVSSVTSKAFDAVSSSLGSAISRVDTLNQFPKVMQSLGFSSDAASASMKKLSAGIEGLPTSLDNITASTQKIALMTGDLDTATDTAIALNDAFLSSGSGAEDASRGLTQYVQMLSKGKPDAQSWNSILETMGPALSKVAKQLGYTSTRVEGDLYNALMSGTLSFDDFNAAIVEADQATGGFAESAASASAGIQTSMTNATTAITKNLANVIDAINGAGLISGFFDGIKNTINAVGGAVTPVAQKIGEAIPAALQAVSDKVKVFTDRLTQVESMTHVLQTLKAELKYVIDTFKLAISEAIEPFKEKLSDIFNGQNFKDLAVQVQVLAVKFQTFIKDSGGIIQVTKNLKGLVPVVAGLAGSFAALSKYSDIVNILSGIKSTAGVAATGFGKLKVAAGDVGAGISLISESWSTTAGQLANVGSKLATPFIKLGSAMGGVVGSIKYVASAYTSELGSRATGALKNLGSEYAEAFAPLGNIANKALAPVKSALSGLSEGFSGTFGVLTQFISPAALVAAVIAGLAAGFVYMYTTNEQFRESVQGIITQMGTALAPVIQQVQALIQQLMPILQQIGNVITTVILPTLGNLALVVMQFIANLLPMISPILSMIITLITNVMTVIQTVVQTALTILQTIINIVLALINGDWQAVWSGILLLIQTVWNGIYSVVSTLITAVQNIISSIISTIQAVWEAAWTAVGNLLTNAWNLIIQTVTGGADNVLSVVSGIPDGILGFFANAGDLLLDSGKAIIDGLLSGIEAAIGGVYDFVSGIAGTIASLKGPLSYDRVLLTPAGEAIVSGLYNGIASTIGTVYRLVGGIADNLADEMTVGASAALSTSGSMAIEADETSLTSWLAANLPAIIANNAPQTIIDNDAGALIVDNRLQQLQRRAGMNVG